MTTFLHLDLGERSYPIAIGTGLIDDTARFAPLIHGTHVAVVTNDTVAPLYLERLKKSLAPLGKTVIEIVLPDGEQYKTWQTLNRIFDALLAHQADRKTTLIALGGGVIGDMTGFAAACYMRGVPFIQVPTTLLSQVDSSVGGKTGINHPLGKNMIGAFNQPVAVLIDIGTLATLPPRQLAAGMAEVIKHGAIADADYFAWLEHHIDGLNAGDPQLLAQAVKRSCEIKASVVAQDEREGGLRAILNFGHTFGHAIEAGMGYGAWLHGEAVGCGMVIAADLSRRLGHLDAATSARIRALVAAAKLPVVAPDLGAARWHALMQVDKKASGGVVKYVLLSALGRAFVSGVDHAQIDPALAAAVKS